MDVHQRDVELLAEDALDALGLALAQHAVVHEDAGQLVAHRAVDKGRGDRGVDAPGKSQNHPVVADAVADLGDLGLDQAVHGPCGLQAADVEQEVGQHLVAVLAVTDLGVELGGEQLALGVLVRGDGAVLGRGRDDEALGGAVHGVAVAHPDDLPVRRGARHEGGLARARERGGTVLALVGVRDVAAELDRHDLLAVAEAQHGDAHVEDPLVHVGGVVGVHGGGTAREDDRGGAHRGELVGADVTRDDLGVHVQVADATRDELAVLGAKVEDDDQLAGGAVGHGDLRFQTGPPGRPQGHRDVFPGPQ